MARKEWPDESFDEKVKALIRDRLGPLASECREEDDVLALCVACITTGVRLMYDMGYGKDQIEDRLLMTVDVIMLTDGVTERGQFETVH